MKPILAFIAISLCIIIGLSFIALKTIQSPKAFAYTQSYPPYNPGSGPSYAVDTSECAFCHRMHTATGDHLVLSREESDLCFSCHDGTGSNLNTKQEFYKTYSHKLNGVEEGSKMDCSNCHEPHRYVSGGYKLVNPTSTTLSWDVIDDPFDTDYDNASPPSGLYRWCERCHVSSTQTGILLTSQSLPYVPYEVDVDWKTSRSPTSSIPGVPENGNTAGSWEYFTSSHYNDTNGSSGEWHGAGSTTGNAIFTEPYDENYPAMPCTDCHSHHGSSQPWMVKDTLSLTYSVVDNYDMTTGSFVGQYRFCIACHDWNFPSNCTEEGNFDALCTDCHRHGSNF